MKKATKAKRLLAAKATDQAAKVKVKEKAAKAAGKDKVAALAVSGWITIRL